MTQKTANIVSLSEYRERRQHPATTLWDVWGTHLFVHAPETVLRLYALQMATFAVVIEYYTRVQR